MKIRTANRLFSLWVTQGGILEVFDASPSAASLIEGLRDFGYTFNTSVADIIDNSIAASATHIDILASFSSGIPRVAFVDNGRGMTGEELRTAMRPGSQSPKELRASFDLGRFGLGLKTASFAQCRKLTVVTRLNGVANSARWDLDYVASSNTWSVLVPTTEGTFGLEQLPETEGTLILWEEIDRIGVDGDNIASEDHFNELLSNLSDHLGLVFHRFLDGQAKRHKKLTIAINGRSIDSVNPFNPSNQRTNRRPEERLSNGAVVTPYVLPHPKTVSPSEFIAFEGVSGYVNSQGFYLYRVDRLIVWATWFGVARKSPSTKLLRISIDIDNDSDEKWQINVLKASANLPRDTKRELKKLIDRWRGTARSTFTRRETVKNLDSRFRTWTRLEADDVIRYEVDMTAPIIEHMLEGFNEDEKKKVANLFQIVASDLPVESLFVDLSDHQERVETDVLSIEAASDLTSGIIQILRLEGHTDNEIEKVLNDFELLQGHSAIVPSVIEGRK
jgi:hypothetical protein